MGMINLISPETKKQIKAARINFILIRHCILLGGAALGTFLIFSVGLWVTFNFRSDAEERKAKSEQAAEIYAETKKEAEEFTSNLSQTKTILSSNLSFYQLLTKIAAVVPPGVILSNLSLGASSLESPVTISARGSSYEAILIFKKSLIDSNVVSSVNLNSVKDGETNDGLSNRYPIDAIISATFSKEFIEEVSQ